jgi:hypothetical protein
MTHSVLTLPAFVPIAAEFPLEATRPAADQLGLDLLLALLTIEGGSTQGNSREAGGAANLIGALA